MDTPQHYKVIITTHARERWLERIVDPQRYSHLKQCPGCQKCNDLLFDIRYIIKQYGRDIDRSIIRRLMCAKESGAKVTDPAFQESIKKQYPNEKLEFYVDGDAVFVIGDDPTKPIPVLLSVLTYDMIDGTLLRGATNKQELDAVFKKWHFEARQRQMRKL